MGGCATVISAPRDDVGDFRVFVRAVIVAAGSLPGTDATIRYIEFTGTVD
jgi:predicted oxidoreductase